MKGLNSMTDLFKKKGEEFVTDLLNSYVVINERLNGSYFAVRLTETDEYQFFKKNGEITHADRVLNRFYNKAIRHFEELPDEIKLEIPYFYLFCFEYFPSKARLVLSHIHELNSDNSINKTLQSKALLESWARTLLVENPPIFFEGRLSEEQKGQIMQYIYTQDEETATEMHKVPFSDFLISALEINNPDLDGLVFRFYPDEAKTEEKVTVAKMLNPAIEELIKDQPKTNPSHKADDFIWLILMDLMNYIESFSQDELLAVDLKQTSAQKRYVELVNKLYAKYIREYGEKWVGLDIRIPEYLKSEEFDVNTDLVGDEDVVKLIQSNEVQKEIYRILLNSFRNPNIKVSSKLFSDGMRQNLKSQVERLSQLVLQNRANESYFPTFYDFLSAKDLDESLEGPKTSES